MGPFFNILITSISKKVPLIKTVRQAAEKLHLQLKLYGGDANPSCIGRFFVDEFWQMPFQNELSKEDILHFCQNNQIKIIIPTRDDELPLFSENEIFFKSHGIFCLISKKETIDTCRNKLLFYEHLSSLNIPAIHTTKNIQTLNAKTYVVKECFGSGSNSIGLNLPFSQSEALGQKMKDPIFQPFIEGDEYSVDVYLSRDQSLQEAIVRKREVIVDGESQITSSLKHEEMRELCLKAANVLGIYGHAVFQVICDASNHLHIIECNPRFGGASTLSVAMGLCSFEWFIQECLELPLTPFTRSTKEKKLIRYPKDKIILL